MTEHRLCIIIARCRRDKIYRKGQFKIPFLMSFGDNFFLQQIKKGFNKNFHAPRYYVFPSTFLNSSGKESSCFTIPSLISNNNNDIIEMSYLKVQHFFFSLTNF